MIYHEDKRTLNDNNKILLEKSNNIETHRSNSESKVELDHVKKIMSYRKTSEELSVNSAKDKSFQEEKQSTSTSEVLQAVNKSRQMSSDEKKVSQLLWIEKEIQHLKHLKQMILFSEKEKQMLLTDEPIQVKIYENMSECDTRNREVVSVTEHEQYFNNNGQKLKMQASLVKKKHRKETNEKGFIKSDNEPVKSKVHHHNYETKSISSANKNHSKTEIDFSKSSDTFASSGSISLPLGDTITNTTKEHDLQLFGLIQESHKHCTVQTQTSNSAKLTNPIYESLPQVNSTTKMIDMPKINKNQQTNPSGMAYVFALKEKKGYRDSKEDKINKEDKKTILNGNLRAINDDVYVMQSLEDYFSEKNPRIWNRIDQRNQCIKELRNLR